MNPQETERSVSGLKRTGVSIEATLHNLTIVRKRLNAIAEHFQELDTALFRHGITTIWEHTRIKAAREQLEATRHQKQISNLPRECEI